MHGFQEPSTRDRKTIDRMERFAQFALAATREALAEAQGLDLVPNAARELAPGSAVLPNSFGFGGHNVCLALSSLS